MGVGLSFVCLRRRKVGVRVIIPNNISPVNTSSFPCNTKLVMSLSLLTVEIGRPQKTNNVVSDQK